VAILLCRIVPGWIRRGLAGFSFYVAPVEVNAYGLEVGYSAWQDEPLEAWGHWQITSAGVLKLAEGHG
jgi:hypothetical protein